MPNLPLQNWLFDQLKKHLEKNIVAIPAVLFDWFESSYKNLLTTNTLIHTEFLNHLTAYHRLLVGVLEYRSETSQKVINRDLNPDSISFKTLAKDNGDILGHLILIAYREDAARFFKSSKEGIFSDKVDISDDHCVIKSNGNEYHIIKPLINEETSPDRILEALTKAISDLRSSQRDSVSIVIDSPPSTVLNYIYTAYLLKYNLQWLKSLRLYFIGHEGVESRIKKLHDLRDFSKRYGIAEYCDNPLLPEQWWDRTDTMRNYEESHSVFSA